MVEVVVVSSDDGMEAEEGRKAINGGGPSSEVVLWEKYMPKVVLRVLLVEADDSTRHVIADLLRKCSYIVSAVPDGLMAWETLKGRPQNIDLVLTELDLPSISGFALLTLIMEHETCKNIPVIMMSSQDSFGMVLKCLLKGASDYLIKPVRKNELRNLWQHVWRRNALAARPVCHSLPASEPKLEVTAENGTDSRDYLTSTHKNGNKKGYDAQSSCSSRFKEAESEYVPNVHVAKQPDAGSPTLLKESAKEGGGDMRLDGIKDSSVWRENMSELSCTTMDLIGAFEGQPNCHYGVNCYAEHVGPELELSLRRLTSKGQGGSERQSNTSAFSRYDNGKPVVVAAASGASEPKTWTEFPGQLKMVSSDVQSSSSNNQENMGSCIISRQCSPIPGKASVEAMKARQEQELGCQSCSADKSTEQQHVGDGKMEQQRWRQREAALSKFRLKRKDRCFEKKVRYQSRKKLAEQRPRVRGQFVRALDCDEIPHPHVSNGP